MRSSNWFVLFVLLRAGAAGRRLACDSPAQCRSDQFCGEGRCQPCSLVCSRASGSRGGCSHLCSGHCADFVDDVDGYVEKFHFCFSLSKTAIAVAELSDSEEPASGSGTFQESTFQSELSRLQKWSKPRFLQSRLSTSSSTDKEDGALSPVCPSRDYSTLYYSLGAVAALLVLLNVLLVVLYVHQRRSLKARGKAERKAERNHSPEAAPALSKKAIEVAED